MMLSSSLLALLSLASFLPFPPGQTQVIEGRLDKGDNTLKGGEYVDVHKVEVTESGEFTVRLNGDFDGYLIVQPPDYATTKEGQLENDDWEGDLTESRIVVENAQVGTWTVAVTTASKGVGGSYRLSLDLPGAGGDDASPRSKRTERGELSADDPTLGGGEHFDRFEIELGAGDVLTARLESSDFDTYLALADADANSLVQNDDFEGSQSVSQIEYTAETAQQVILIATSAKKGETGSYVLTLLQAGEHGDGRHYSGELSEGDEALETGSFVDLESLRGTPGARLRVDVTSPEFDTLLFVMDGEGEIIDRNDDFEGDAKHSRVEFTVPAGGSYIVAVTSYAKAEGTYEVRITPLDGAPSGEAGESGPVVRTENGRLEKGDATLETGEFLDVYPLEVTEGEELHIELDSADFDAYLILVQLEGDPIQQDDFDGSTNPRLDYIATGTGTVNVVVTSAKPGETGDYALTIQRGSGTEEESALDTLTGELANGDSTLDTGEFYDSFEYEMVEGRTYLIAMSSADFNAYVGVIGPEGQIAADDDGGGDRDAFLIFEPEVSGPHHITATSSKAGETGSYTVLITSLDLRGEDTAEDSAADGTAMRTSGEGGTPTLRLDQSVEGALAEGDPTLENGEFRDSWLFRASKGQSLHFEVSSTDFDTYMVLVDSEENVLQNDDLDGARDRSGIDWTAPSDGPVLVVVTSYRKGETGNYRLVATGGGAAGETASISGRVYGVFLGISDYPGTDNDLPLCDRDAVHLQRVLVEHAGMEPEDGLVLINREARIDAVRKAVRDVAGRMQDGDLFVFFYSGHGARVKRTELVPHDPDGHDALDEALVLYDEPLLDDDLDTLLASVDHGTVLVILDSCFSGGFSKDVISRPNRMGLFSSHEDVTSATAAKFKAGGYLAAFAAEAVSSESDIADENGDGLIDAAELSQYIYEGYRNELVRAKSSDYLDVGDNLGYQQLIVDRGGVGVKQPLFRVR